MNFLDKMSLKGRVLVIAGVGTFLTAAIAIIGFNQLNEYTLTQAVHEAQRDVMVQLKNASEFVADQNGLPKAAKYIKEKYKDPKDISDEDKKFLMSQVPIVAAMTIGKKSAADIHMTFRIFSDEPRNKENQATAEEMIVFNKFLADPNLKEYTLDDEKTGDLVVYHAVRLSEAQGCLTCHGSPSISPWGNGKDILGYRMEDWKDGKLHGVFSLKQARENAEKVAAGTFWISPSGILISVIVLGGIIALAIAAYMTDAPLKKLAHVSNILGDVSNSVNTAAIQIASSSEELSSATSEQAASLEETAASIEQMSSMVNKNSDNAKGSLESAETSKSKAEQGQEIIEQMRQSILEIDQSNQNIMDQVNSSNQQMLEIVTVIQEIGNKTKVINDIVFQTKLLSFNASVEAARAGEHGKGFAVVAEEVGNLAQMSGNAAKEISTMLHDSIGKVEKIAQDTKEKIEVLVSDGRQKIEAGTEIAKQCGDVLNEIVDNAGTVAQLANEISTASQEQALGVAEINKAMNQLDQVTQQNAAAGEEAASSAEMLSQQSEQMETAMRDLMSTVYGAEHVQLQRNNSGKSEFKATKKEQKNVLKFKKKDSVKGKFAATGGQQELDQASGDAPNFKHPDFK